MGFPVVLLRGIRLLCDLEEQDTDGKLWYFSPKPKLFLLFFLLPGTHPLAKHREQMIQPLPVAISQLLQLISVKWITIIKKNCNYEKKLSTCAAHDGKLRSGKYPCPYTLLHCCSSSPAFSFRSMLSFQYHTDMTLGSGGGKQNGEGQ